MSCNTKYSTAEFCVGIGFHGRTGETLGEPVGHMSRNWRVILAFDKRGNSLCTDGLAHIREVVLMCVSNPCFILVFAAMQISIADHFWHSPEIFYKTTEP